MPVQVSYPGVYIEEVPSGVRTIVGVATSITAFIGRSLRGPVNDPQRIQSFADFERVFGGLWSVSPLGYAIQQYFLNGGTDAIIVRIARSQNADASKNAAAAVADQNGLKLKAASVGEWGNQLTAVVDHATVNPADNKLFNLTIRETSLITGAVSQAETFRNISVESGHQRFVLKVLEAESRLARVELSLPDTRPSEGTATFDGGSDGEAPTFTEYEGSPSDKSGIYSLEKTDLFNLLCLTPVTRDAAIADTTGGKALLSKALAYCKSRRAMLLVDPPSSWKSVTDVTGGTDSLDSIGVTDENAAIFFPPIKVADSLKENRLEEFPPAPAVAGIFARTDAQRGVWKAPAGQEAVLAGVQDLSVKLTDNEQGQLNPLGVNCLRSFPIIGNVVWGSRTTKGADRLASEWKYISVRRTALFLEESLYRGTQWVVFEPNDEPLWAQIRLNLGAFMQNLFRQGAFQGKTPREAYFVKCDKESTTQNDINQGIVNIIVGFAPLKPAEFVVIKFQQMAGTVAN